MMSLGGNTTPKVRDVAAERARPQLYRLANWLGGYGSGRKKAIDDSGR